MNLFLRLAALFARIMPQPLKQWLYHIQPLAKWLRRKLNEGAPQGLIEVKVAAGAIAGMKLLLNMQTEKDYWLGTYEPDLQNAAQKFVQPGMVIYDVGANIGYISLMMAHLSGSSGQIFSFEALPINVQRLQKNIALNQMESIVRVIPKAVIGSSQPVKFLAHSSSSMGKARGSAGREEQYEGEIKVAGLSLDDFIYSEGNPAPALIKMDIEGGEILAVKGMLRLLKEKHPLLFIELHGEEASREVWLALSDAGYEVLKMERGYERILSLDQLRWKSYIIARKASK